MDDLSDLFFIIIEERLNQIVRDIIKDYKPVFNVIGEELADLDIEFFDCNLPDYIIKGDIPDIEFSDYL
jgi:glycerol-3-phosphate cytidylyltransferase-like family protein